MKPQHIDKLIALIGDDERVSVHTADREAHSQDESFHKPHLPDVVIWPESTEEISHVLSWANEHRVPVTPWSGGSSLEGNPIPVRGGILLAMYRQNRILKVREVDLQVRVQPGIIYDDLNKRLSRYGLFFPPAPGSSDVATIGGMAANNSSGMHAVKYGVTGDYVLALEAVLATGEIIHTGSRALKSASGYDLTRLFVGSEGTLGVITEITLRLQVVPEKIAAVAVFPSPKEAAQATFEINRYAPTPAGLEWMDEHMVALVNRWKGMSLPEAPTMVMEFHGTPEGARAEAEFVGEICRDCGCTDFEMGQSQAERDRLWAGRKAAHKAAKHLHPDYTLGIGDIVVPISKYPEAVETAYAAGRAHDIPVYTFGHAGDGNLHLEILMHKDDPTAQERGAAVSAKVVNYAISVGGTATGEHGVGIGKRQFMAAEHGASLKVMKRIKHLLDPNGILNPGKIFQEI
ncbi:MAG: FAD-binding oxidoreductase [Chloroflexi bacterium]|nr:FAD-binding oxidoreductase [Chloroflexota bacterium]